MRTFVSIFAKVSSTSNNNAATKLACLRPRFRRSDVAGVLLDSSRAEAQVQIEGVVLPAEAQGGVLGAVPRSARLAPGCQATGRRGLFPAL